MGINEIMKVPEGAASAGGKLWQPQSGNVCHIKKCRLTLEAVYIAGFVTRLRLDARVQERIMSYKDV